jgi:hypothetical protein
MRDVFQQTGVIPLVQMHDALEFSTASHEQAETVARLGVEAVSLNVPMVVDLKYGRTWGEASLKKSPSWEELTGKPAPAKPASKPAPKPARVIPPKPTTIIPPKPAISIPLPPPSIVVPHRPAITIPLSTPSPVETKRELPPPPPLDDSEIDLADLVDCEVPRDRMVLCPFHGETKPSMRIYPDHYYCYGCHAWGDHVDWLMQVEGLEYADALYVVENWQGPVVPRSPAHGRPEEDARRTAYALTWWDAAKPIQGTLAARYLADTRGIDLDVLSDDISERSLRFHPRCVFGPGTRHPCLLALMRNPTTGEPTGIQRIALTPDARKIDRMMLGPAGVVQLWPAGQQLVIGEGLETTLAAAQGSTIAADRYVQPGRRSRTARWNNSR